MEELRLEAARGLDKGLVLSLATGEYLAKAESVLISGATGSGKTTLLGALLTEVPADERIIIVEDTRELRPAHGHVVSLQARAGNSEGSGAVSLADLVRQALRMRPDRLVVGECRGAEVRELFTALNTGHAGAGTVHANSAADVVPRFEALGALAGLDADAHDDLCTRRPLDAREHFR